MNNYTREINGQTILDRTRAKIGIVFLAILFITLRVNCFVLRNHHILGLLEIISISLRRIFLTLVFHKISSPEASRAVNKYRMRPPLHGIYARSSLVTQ